MKPRVQAELTATTLLLLLATSWSQTPDLRLAAELKCLNTAPGDQCNLQLTYGDPLGTLGCNQVVPEGRESILGQAPTLRLSKPSSVSITDGLIVTFDPDAPVSNQPQDGYVHWIAIVRVSSNGSIEVRRVEKDYYPPAPPRGRGSHRYQTLLFRFNPSSVIVVDTGRKLNLCAFVGNNNLGQPVAAGQFFFGRT